MTDLRPSLGARLLASLRSVAGLFSRTEDDRRLQEEVRFHVDMQTARLVETGMNEAEARRVALLQFGGRERWKEAARAETRAGSLEDAAADLRFAVRRLRREPGLTAAAILTVGLGIAASATALGFANSLFLSRLDVPTAERLVRIDVERTRGNIRPVDYPSYRYLADRVQALDRLAGHYSTAPLYVSTGPERGRTSEIQGAVVSADYFPMLQLVPAAGRFFADEEYLTRDRYPVAVIGYDLWQRTYGGQRDAVGRTLVINGRQFTIVGVAPRGFDGVLPGSSVNELWIPLAMLSVGYRWCDAYQPDCSVLHLLGRVAPESTLEDAQREVAMLVGRAPPPEEADSVRRATVSRAVGVSTGMREHYGQLALLLGAIAALVFAIACINVSGLLLARGVTREREMALRASLGASRLRLVRQLLTESMLLGVMAWGAGLALSLWASAGLRRFLTVDAEGYVRHFAAVPTERLALVAGALALLAVMLFGLLPALEASRTNLAGRMASGRSGADRRANRARSALLAGQLALSFGLVAAGALLTRSVGTLASVEGSGQEGVALLRLRPRLAGYTPAQAQTMLRNSVRALHSRPEVQSLALVSRGGAYGGGFSETMALPGEPPPRRDGRGVAQPTVRLQETTPGFFETMGVPIVEGRGFTDQDSAGGPPVALVDNTTAARLWPAGSALGRQVVLGGHTFTVIGVFANYQIRTADRPVEGLALVPFWQHTFEPQVDARLAVRVRGDPAALLPALAADIAAVDPQVPVTERRTLSTSVAAEFGDVRLGRWVAVSAAIVGLVVSAVGLFGLVAFLVARRSREFGVRLALGATPSQIVALVLHQGWAPLAWGAGLGLALALLGARLLSSWLVGVSPFDPVAFGVAVAGMGLVAVAASLVPVRRAARLNPVEVLREE